MTQLTRRISFQPAYDLGKEFGIHGLVIVFSVESTAGAIVWKFHSGLYKKETRKRLESYPRGECYGTPICVHSKHRLDDETSLYSKPCEFLPGSTGCYSKEITGCVEGVTLAELFIAEGDSPVWERLKLEHRKIFTQLSMEGI